MVYQYTELVYQLRRWNFKSLTRENKLVRIPGSTLKLLKRYISEREKGQYKKGMIMDTVNKAVLSYIVADRKSTQEPVTRTQTQSETDKIRKRDFEISRKYDIIHDNMLHIAKADGGSNILTRKEMDTLIINVTGCGGRSLPNKYKELLAYGIISEHLDKYYVNEKTTTTGNESNPPVALVAPFPSEGV